jgi:16S rRNA (guanine(527)-N(7))-methyltransferase RsmG
VFRELLGRCASITDAQAAKLEKHYELLCRWNKVLNLTRVDDVQEAVERHYCESLFVAARIPAVSGLKIADIGSGAGFPGFPIAIVRPDCAVTLIDSHQRKATFLREASRSLKNIHVLATRAELVKEPFDWIVSRAVSYADLERPLRHFGAGVNCRVALLTGADVPPAEFGLEWELVPLPWGRNRFLRVSRETG